MSAAVVNVYKQLGLGGYITNPLSQETIHTMGAVFVDNIDLYTGGDGSVKTTKLWRQTQIDVNQWNNLLQETGGVLKPEKCFWYSIDYTCKEGIWIYTAESQHKITITNPNGDRNTIHQKEVSEEMKTLGVYDSPAGGNK